MRNLLNPSTPLSVENNTKLLDALEATHSKIRGTKRAVGPAFVSTRVCTSLDPLVQEKSSNW